MRGDRTPLLTGLLYGSASGLFGGSVWALIAFLPPDETLIAPRWAVVSGGIAFCLFAGFLVGVFSGPRTTGDKDEPPGSERSVAARALAVIGWLFYRLLVGYFIGIIATLVFCLIGITPWFVGLFLFVDPNKKLLDHLEADVVASAIKSGVFCGFSGGVFGALLVSRRSVAVRSTLGWRAVRGSFLGLLCGILFGAAVGWMPPEKMNGFVFVPLLATVLIGILAGILGGLWTDVRNSRAGRND